MIEWLSAVREKSRKLSETSAKLSDRLLFLLTLSTVSLARILQIPQDSVECKLNYLHLVLSVSYNPKFPVQLLHLPFRDFLVDSTKRDTNRFWLDEEKTHANPPARYLQLLSEKGLKNIYNLEISKK